MHSLSRMLRGKLFSLNCSVLVKLTLCCGTSVKRIMKRPFRFALLIFTFMGICVVLLFYAIRLDFYRPVSDGKQQVSKRSGGEGEFGNVSFFLTKHLDPFLKLDAQKLVIDPETNITTFTFPKGLIYLEKVDPVTFKSISGHVNQKSEKMYLHGDVQIMNPQSEILADRVEYLSKQDQFDAFGGVKSKTHFPHNGDQLFIDSREVTFWPGQKRSRYQGTVMGKIIRKRAYEGKVDFSTDKLTADLKANVIGLTGKVVFTKQNLTAKSIKAQIFLDNFNKKLKYYSLFDDVRVVERVSTETGKVVERKAFGERLEGFTRERKIVLTGSPKVIQGDDVVKGNQITLTENNLVVEVDDSTSRFKIRDLK